MSNRRFRIVSSAGVDMGTFAAATPSDALDAMARDAGYEGDHDFTSYAGAFDGTITDVTDEVSLYESNGGHLMIVCGERAFTGLQYVTHASFAVDAPALASEDVGDWTIDRIASEDIEANIAGMDHVATWTPNFGVTIRDEDCGTAARIYLGIDKA